MLSERRGSFRPQPKQTVAYQVQQSDTLEGIAIRYNITPSELTILNKLNTRVVFPGQTIYIPEKNSLQALEAILKQSAASIAASEQASPKPGHVERVPDVKIDPDVKSDIETHNITHVDTSLADIIKQRCPQGINESLRINSKYVTDGEGVVSGMLIITTNHIIFDPNVSDPLVMEYGMDKYGVEAPMSYIVRAALYTDIFRMRSKDVIHTGSSNVHVNVYHSKNLNVKKSKSHTDKLSKIEKSKHPRRFSATELGSKRMELGVPTSNSFQENLAKICESTDADEDAADDVTSPEDVAKIDHSETDTSVHPNSKIPLSPTSSVDSEESYPFRKSSLTDEDAVFSPESGSPKKKSNFEKTKNKLHKGLKKLSLSDGLFSTAVGSRRMSLPTFTTSLSDFKLKNASAKNALSHDKVKTPPETEKVANAVYVNMVEDKPELFAPLDSPTTHDVDVSDDDMELIPRMATSFCDTPLYLCLRMGEPISKPSHTGTVVHFSHRMKPEYWFSIPKDSVDNLYFFFLRWCPEKYGDIDKIDMEAMGYLQVEHEEVDSTEETCEKSAQSQRRASWAFPWRKKPKDVSGVSLTSSPEGWEFLDYFGARCESVHPPELRTPSKILSDEQLLELNKHLPARAMNPWQLIYGTADHGFSLKTMYRHMLNYDSPVLIVIANRNNAIFGALLSSPLKMSDHFYGTGESFLFTFHSQFKIYNWSGVNDYFIKGNIDSFFVGSSEGHFGLWLDDDLFRGRTNSCLTFANDPLCPEEDFEIKSLEAWGFV